MMKTGQARLAERVDDGCVSPELRRVAPRRVRVGRHAGGSGAEAANGRVPGGRARVALVREGETERVARRWRAFLALAVARGVPAEAVTAGFTDADIADLCAAEHDDAMLERCVDTLVASLRCERTGHDGTLVDEAEKVWGATPVAPTVRCADCRHFRRRTTHPRLGDCTGGGTGTVAAGFWDTQERGCDAFAPLAGRTTERLRTPVPVRVVRGGTSR